MPFRSLSHLLPTPAVLLCALLLATPLMGCDQRTSHASTQPANRQASAGTLDQPAQSGATQNPDATAPAGTDPAAADQVASLDTGWITLDSKNMRKQDGFAYWIAVPDDWSAVCCDSEHPARSTLVLEEDGKPLGPGNVSHNTIRAQGEGRFSHWGNGLYFSASDNSDPTTNGRVYRARVP